MVYGHNGDTCHNLVLKRSSGVPPGRCPACSSPGYTYLVFVDLENVGGFCQPSRIVLQEPSSPHPCWYGTAPSLGPVFSLLFLLFLVSLIVALHFPLAAGLQREVSQLATAAYTRHHHPPQARDTGAFRPRAGLPHWCGQSPWWLLALLPGHRSRDTV